MDLQVLINALAILGLAFSGALCFYGYALFRFVIGFAGFLVSGALGGFLTYVAIDGESMLAAILIGLVAGCLGAWASWTLYKLGVFLWGAIVGALLVALLFLANDHAPEPLVIGLFAIVGGVIALSVQKAWVVISTALIGAVGLVGGLGMTLGGLGAPSFGPSAHLGNAPVFVFLVAWLGLTAVGATFQLRAASKAEPLTPPAPGSDPTAAPTPTVHTRGPMPEREPPTFPARPLAPTAPLPTPDPAPDQPNAVRALPAAAAILAVAAVSGGAGWLGMRQLAGPTPMQPTAVWPGGTSSAAGPQRAAIGDDPTGAVYATQFPSAFLGIWDDAEGCETEDGTDSIMRIEPRAVSYWESYCGFSRLEVAGNRVFASAFCEGEGETWADSLDLELVGEDVLLSRERNGSSYSLVRCQPRPQPPPTQPIDTWATVSARPAQGVVGVEGTRVTWHAPEPHTPNLATFSFEMQGYENTYELDCRYRSFRWVSNLDLRTRRYTDHMQGAEWRTLDARSTKANAAFEAACR
jgi:hypothetical protein